MGVRRKGLLGLMRFWLRLFTEGVSWALETDDQSRRLTALNFPVVTDYKGQEDGVTKQGAKEVLDLFLSHGDDEEDEIFVTTLWWSLVAVLVICCIKRLDVIGPVI